MLRVVWTMCKCYILMTNVVKDENQRSLSFLFILLISHLIVLYLIDSLFIVKLTSEEFMQIV